MKKDGFIAVVVTVLVLVALAAGGVWYYYAAHSSQSNKNSSQPVNGSSPATATGQKTYSSAQYGVALRFPSGDTFIEGPISSYPSAQSIGYKKEMTEFDNVSNVVVLGSLEIPASKDQEAALPPLFMGVSVDPSVTDVANCEDSAVEHSNNPVSYSTVNNIKYSESYMGVFDVGGTDFFHTLQNGMCYEFAFMWMNLQEGQATQWNETTTFMPLLSGISFTAPTH